MRRNDLGLKVMDAHRGECADNEEWVDESETDENVIMGQNCGKRVHVRNRSAVRKIILQGEKESHHPFLGHSSS